MDELFDCGHGVRAMCHGCRNAAAETRLVLNPAESFTRQRRLQCVDCGHFWAFIDEKPFRVTSASEFDYASVKHLAKSPGAEVTLCRPCAEWLPSAFLRPFERAIRAALKERAELSTKIDAFEERIENGESEGFWCDEHEGFCEDDPCLVRECSKDTCGETFNGDEHGRNCPECNSPFTRRLAEQGCPECLQESEVQHFADLENMLEEFKREMQTLETKVDDAQASLVQEQVRMGLIKAPWL